MPVFLTMTHGMTDRERQSVVSRATLVAFITIMVFTFAGQFLFKFFGISTNGFRIAGGVIIFKIGFDMLQARYTPMKLKDEEIKTYACDIEIFSCTFVYRNVYYTAMDTILPFALLCFTSFFTLTNPLGTMPVFLTMTHGMTDRERQSVVSRATLVAFITIMVFTFAGQFLFKFFGISTNGFRIAGGVIIFKIGFDMLQARYTPMKLKDEEIKTYADDISITPLGIPMLCGPGAIANAIVLMQDAHTIQMKGVLIGMIAFIYLITFFILRASTRLVKILGETGNNVMMRLMGLILMVIAVECFVSGVKPILVDILKEGGIPSLAHLL